MRRVLDFLYDAAGSLAAFFIFTLFAVMIGATVMRELGLATGGSDDIVSWLCAAAGFFGMAHTFKRGDFVRVTLLLDNLGARARHAFEVGSLAIATAFCAYLFWAAASFVYQSWQFGDMANGLVVIKLWIPQSSFVFGAALLVVAVVDELVIVLRGRKPTYVVAVEERHAKGDFTEDI